MSRLKSEADLSLRKIARIKLANAVKLGRHEQTTFELKNDYRSHGTEITIEATKVGKSEQPVVKLKDIATGEEVYTSLMNTIYWQYD